MPLFCYTSKAETDGIEGDRALKISKSAFFKRQIYKNVISYFFYSLDIRIILVL